MMEEICTLWCTYSIMLCSNTRSTDVERIISANNLIKSVGIEIEIE